LQPANVSHRLIKKIKDDRFDEENLHQYRLLVQLGVRDFQVAVIAESDQRLLFFEDYVLGELHSHSDLLELLKTLFEEHPILQAGFWKQVKVGIKNNKFAQVPSTLFQEGNAAEYLAINTKLDALSEIALSCKNQAIDTVTVFAIKKDLHDWLSGIYKNTQLTFFHQSAALIEGVVSY
jgi:hypothetical protein